MKRILPVVIPMIVVVLILSVSSAQASPTLPTVQMLSTSYTGISTPNMGTFTIVETLPFSISSTAKLEVTSDNATSGGGAASYTCQLFLDGTVLAQEGTSNNQATDSLTSDMTAANATVAAGNHALSVACLAFVSSVDPTSSGTLSTIITTGV